MRLDRVRPYHLYARCTRMITVLAETRSLARVFHEVISTNTISCHDWDRDTGNGGMPQLPEETPEVRFHYASLSQMHNPGD